MTPKQRASYMWRIVEGKPNVMVPWYLMTSWLYYVHDISILPDADFDELCARLLESFPTITHRHKHLVDPESLRAGTGFAITEYPEITQSAGTLIAAEDKHPKLDKKRACLVHRR